MSGERRWASSERIAVRVLESMGYRVLELRKRVRIEGVDVAEIDAIAVGPDGETYAVEIKAGRLDVTGVRQAYTNAVLVGAKPLVVCKGFADESARILAEKLGVKVVQLSDVFLVDTEELEDLIVTAVAETIADVLRLLLDPRIKVKPSHLQVLEAVAEEPTIQDAAEKLGVSVKEVAEKIREMRREGVIPKWARNWQTIRLAASILRARARLQALIDNLENVMERLKDYTEKLTW